MNKENIVNNLYEILSLPKHSTRSQVNKNWKYLKEDLNIVKEVKFGNNTSSNTIKYKEYEPTAFKEMVVIAKNVLLNRIECNKYKLYIKDPKKGFDIIDDKIDDLFKQYPELKDENIATFIKAEYIDINAAYYEEIWKEQLFRISYIKDIQDAKGFSKVSKSLLFFFEFMIPNYWGYLVLLITLGLIIIGVIYGITK